MMTYPKHRLAFSLIASALVFNCAGVEVCAQPAGSAAAVWPASDPQNTGGWVLNESVSDEFAGPKLDAAKWFVEGEEGQFYIWKGRAPSQFAPHNVFIEGGILKLRTQWEPKFPFAQESYADGSHSDKYGENEGKPMPVTTAGVISRKRFLNGYMEVRSKAANAAITSSFWMIGYESELDVYEQMGQPKIAGDITADTLKLSIHDWRAGSTRPNRRFGYKSKLPFRVADEFHVYGVEWGEDYLKGFLDGKEVYSVTQKEVGKNWVLNNPLEVWLDSEIFVWLGLPHQEELPADYQVDYVRVWQKPSSNLLDRAFFGFEGPILFEQHPRPLKLVPESSVEDEYQKFWRIDPASAKHLSIVPHEQFASGMKSLKFSQDGSLSTDEVAAVAPAGSVSLPAGSYVFSAKIWIGPKTAAKKLYVSLADPAIELPAIDLTECAKGEWVTVTRPFARTQDSTAQDGLKIAFRRGDAPSGSSLVYVDDLSIARSTGPLVVSQPPAAPQEKPFPAWIQQEIDKIAAAISDLSSGQETKLGEAVKARVEGIAKVKKTGGSEGKIKTETMNLWSAYHRTVRSFLTPAQFEIFKELQKPKKAGSEK